MILRLVKIKLTLAVYAVLDRIGIHKPESVFYIGGTDTFTAASDA
jgi:hypothetical protein